MYKILSRITSRGNSTAPRWSICLIHQKRNVECESRKSIYPKLSFLAKYLLAISLKYFEHLEKKWTKKFPRAMYVYKMFNTGGKRFFADLKTYMSIRKKLKTNSIDSLSNAELQLYYTVPRDLLKVSPTLLITTIPFTNYLIFPLLYMYPKTFLTSHYWSLQQNVEYKLLDHKNRLKHNKLLFGCMHDQLQSIAHPTLKLKWSDVIASLNNGTHPSTLDVIACIELFTGSPYSLDSLKRKHVKELLAIHGMHQWRLYKRRGLLNRGLLMKRMDNAIRREGGVIKMSNDALQWALSFRGLNPVNMSDENMQNWLDKWLTISSEVNENSISLLLHCPILLAYNHESNCTLVPSDI